MPYSSTEGKPWIQSVLRDVDVSQSIQRVLDVGAGAGSYSKLLRRYIGQHWTAIEVHSPYVDRFGLRSKYDVVLVTDVRAFATSDEPNFCLIICGDVYEHMTGNEAVRVHERLLERCKYLIFTIPIIYYPQGAVYGNNFETHVRDDWTHTEVVTSFSSIERFWVGDILGCYLCRGARAM